MHVAAANPQFLDRSSVDNAALEKEKELLAGQARESGKKEVTLTLALTVTLTLTLTITLVVGADRKDCQWAIEQVLSGILPCRSGNQELGLG